MGQFPNQWQSRSQPGETPAGSGAAAQPGPAGAEADAILIFEPDAVARAIVFHMLDEGLAREVTGESVRRTVSRLRRRGLRLSIRRGAWRVMSNPDRLDWLLLASFTVPLMRPDDDVVSLEGRDEP